MAASHAAVSRSMNTPWQTQAASTGAARCLNRFRRLFSRLVREPLLHFLIAGGVLFGAYAGLNPDLTEASPDASRTVRITANDVEWLMQTWTRQWGRPPTEAELKENVTGYLKEELLAREARALKLDEGDSVVRRRLAQKMEFMVQDTAQFDEPGESELQGIYETERERFQPPARITFTHVYFNRDRRGSRVEADARAALQRLSRAEASAADLGDRFLDASHGVRRAPIDMDGKLQEGLMAGGPGRAEAAQSTRARQRP